MPMRAPRDNTRAESASMRVVLLVAGIVAVVVAAVASGAISLPGLGNGSHAQASSRAGLGGQWEAADRQWAAAACTNILDWKNEIQRDGTGFDSGMGPSARIKDALAATNRLLGQLDKLGLPSTGHTAQARVEIDQLRSEIESRLHAMEGAASSVASGNLLAIGSLVSDLANDRALGTRAASELRHVVSVDLGLSLLQTRTCRQLVGIPL
jgi:hypothetical protein